MNIALIVLAAAAGVHSAPCRDALAALQARESEVLALPAPRRAEALPSLRVLQRQAARACLGGEDPEPGRLAQPPVGAPPAAPLSLPAVPPLSTPAAPPLRMPAVPPLRMPAAPPLTLPPARGAPPLITACDATGCWASDGSRLQRFGPDLIGPRGLCTPVGAMLQCP